MNPIAIPESYDGNNLRECLDFLIDYDQWDDWMPDVVYLRDVSDKRNAYVSELSALRSQRTIRLDHTSVFDVYSENRLKFRTASLPVKERLLIMGAIASQANIVQKAAPTDRLDAFLFRPAPRSAAYEWTADLFGLAFPGGPNGDHNERLIRPLTPVTQSAKPPLFSSLGDGLYAALDATGERLVHSQLPIRSAAWRDVERFYPSIRRPVLWSALTSFRCAPDVPEFLERVSQELAATGDSGLFPIDDAWGFLANAYLIPVDNALSSRGLQYRRSADEYFLMAGDANDRKAATDLLSGELNKIGLRCNAAKNADIELNSAKFSDGAAFWLSNQAFLMSVVVGTTDTVPTLYEQTSVEAWHRILNRVLGEDAACGPHNRTMVMLRTAHFARKEDALVLLQGQHPVSERGRRYRDALASAAWLPDLLDKRLREAAALKRNWTCWWLLLLLSDLGDRAAVAYDAIAGLASATNDSGIFAQATLTLAKTATPGQARPFLEKLKPTGSSALDRTSLVALHFAAARFGGNWTDGRDFGDARLLGYLQSTKKV